MRGKAEYQIIRLFRNGITPAYAGKSTVQELFQIFQWDHPRLCGEKLNAFSFLYQIKRITPAYAGKRCSLSSTYSDFWDHPRLCGEKQAGRIYK